MEEKQVTEEAVTISTDGDTPESGCSSSHTTVEDSYSAIQDDEKEEAGEINLDQIKAAENIGRLVRKRQILMIVKRLNERKLRKRDGGCFRSPDHRARICAIHCRKMDRNKRPSTCMTTNKNQCLRVSPKKLTFITQDINTFFIF